jgi:hypothetical protein
LAARRAEIERYVRWMQEVRRPGADQLTFVDIDSLLRRVYGHQKRGARFGPAKVGGYPVLPAWVVAAGGHDLHPAGGRLSNFLCKQGDFVSFL